MGCMPLWDCRGGGLRAHAGAVCGRAARAAGDRRAGRHEEAESGKGTPGETPALPVTA